MTFVNIKKSNRYKQNSTDSSSIFIAILISIHPVESKQTVQVDENYCQKSISPCHSQLALNQLISSGCFGLSILLKILFHSQRRQSTIIMAWDYPASVASSSRIIVRSVFSKHCVDIHEFDWLMKLRLHDLQESQ